MPPKTIPMTPMTRRYRRFKDERVPEEVRLREAEDLDPDELIAEIDESVAQFSSYANDEAFHPGDRKPLPAPGVGNTDEVASLLKDKEESPVAEDPSLSFRYVDREIVVARTTGGAHYNTPEREKATKGIRADLLLKMSESDGAAIGEVKVGRDVDPYLGLIQALAGACQLATPNQLSRLQDAYEEQVRFAADQPVAALVVLAGVPAREGATFWHRLHERALELAEAIDRKTGVLGRVAIVEVLVDGSVRPSSPVPE